MVGPPTLLSPGSLETFAPLDAPIDLPILPGPSLPGVATDADQIAALMSAWESLANEFPSPIEQAEWTAACFEALGHRGRPQVLIDATDGQLRGVAPLVIDRSRWPARAELAGVAALQEPMDLVYSDAASLERLAGRLLDLGLPLSLDRVPRNSPTLSVLRRVFAGRGKVIERARPSAPYVALSPAWQDPASQLSARRRSDLRRAWKRAEEFGAIKCEVVTPDPTQLDELIDEALAIEARSWKGAAGTALVYDLPLAAFYRRYAHAACRRGTLRMSFLRFGRSTVAMQIAIESARRFWLLKIGYDEQFARCSPGNLLICETLRYAARQKLDSYEFLGASEDWTRVWTTTERPTVRVRIYPYNAAGLAALALDGLGRIKQRLRRRTS